MQSVPRIVLSEKLEVRAKASEKGKMNDTMEQEIYEGMVYGQS